MELRTWWAPAEETPTIWLNRTRDSGTRGQKGFFCQRNAYLMTTKMEVQSERIPVTIEGEWQIGLAIAKQSGPFKIWFMDFQHLGLVYRFNTDGSFRAITFNFRSPFTR